MPRATYARKQQDENHMCTPYVINDKSGNFVVKEEKQNTTVILTSNDKSISSECDVVVNLNQGKIVKV